MFNYRLIVIAFGGILGLSTVKVAAQAGDGYCREYANTAVNQSRAARANNRCAHFIRDLPARWSLNYNHHFHTCLPLFGSGKNASEEQARTADLNECTQQLTSPTAAPGGVAYCRGYADTAVNQSQAARADHRCDHFIRDLPARWSLNFNDHFHACLPLFGSGQNALDLEDQARIADLNQCIHQRQWSHLRNYSGVRAFPALCWSLV